MTEHNVEEQNAVRILASVTRKSPYWSSVWDATEDFLPTVVEQLEISNLVPRRGGAELPLRLLAKHRWPNIIHIVFDISNNDYDAALAHLPQNSNLPVVSVYFGRVKARSAPVNAGILTTCAGNVVHPYHACS